MKLKITREIQTKGDDKKLLLEVDGELLNLYRAEMDIGGFDLESFNKWLKTLVQYNTDGEDWKYD